MKGYIKSMNIKRFFVLFMSVMLLFLLLSGCGGREEIAKPDPIGEPGENLVTDNIVDDIIEDNHSHFHGIDFDSAIAAFPPDTVMIKADNLNITWAELYVFLFQTVSNIMHSYGVEIDWTVETGDGVTLADLVLEYSTEEAISFLVFRNGIDLVDLVITDDDLDGLNDEINSLVEMYDNKEEFEESLRVNGGFYDYDVFLNLLKIEYSVSLLFDFLYGEDADRITDEQVSEYAKENEYMMAMHILFMKTEDDDETPLTDAKNMLTQLKAKENSPDFADFFHEMMHEYSEDSGGLLQHPDGYLFLFSDMVEPFSIACAELEIGQLSDIVETVYGYHILLRLPVDYDASPISPTESGFTGSLRVLTALEDFNTEQQKWRDNLNIEFTPDYYTIDLTKIFEWQGADCDH